MCVLGDLPPCCEFSVLPRLQGCIGDAVAKEHGFTREQQDAYALESYARANKAIQAGYFDKEIVPVTLPAEKKYGIREDGCFA